MGTAVNDRPPPTGEGLTYEKVWAMFQETDLKFQKLERIVKRNGKQMGDLHRRFGQLAEHLVAPGIFKRFNELGYHFSEVSPGGHRIYDERGKIKAEVDILLENGDCIVGVEVKARPAVKDVEYHVRRLETLREHRNKIQDKRKIQGAVAGAIYDDGVKEAVREAGLFVIEQSGDTMKIDMPDDFVPREW
ncbi:MAG: hypothetical protein LBH20_07900 [Treponema sp.]|jgi:hypothetical protein|nr:hypothetical protein [Treponema sp.]